ncbi:hypothetical protein E2C01_076418 [Portunus trituberculatus]|uniref:Uncharacterized protein n=1 Tax=Portunus trituberculatus TaxID=210409 RepID=A0A5B7INH6_PORTR|nr:hypothetical protein [Portunus trituberculatus]
MVSAAEVDVLRMVMRPGEGRCGGVGGEWHGEGGGREEGTCQPSPAHLSPTRTRGWVAVRLGCLRRGNL